MIRGIGVDLVDVGRVRALLERFGSRAERRLFTPGEMETCGQRASADTRAECLAARFAAKEAFLKAVGGGAGGGLSWREMEVSVTESGDPELSVRGSAAARLEELVPGGRGRLHLSLSHESGSAVAVVIVEEVAV